MKKLQNNYTTPEQSKRLLELGVPADSADCYYGKDRKIHHIDGSIPYSLLWQTDCVPCWSVGRLIEITKICITDKDALTEIFELLRDCTFITRNLCLLFEEYSDVLDLSKLGE